MPGERRDRQYVCMCTTSCMLPSKSDLLKTTQPKQYEGTNPSAPDGYRRCTYTAQSVKGTFVIGPVFIRHAPGNSEPVNERFTTMCPNHVQFTGDLTSRQQPMEKRRRLEYIQYCEFCRRSNFLEVKLQQGFRKVEVTVNGLYLQYYSFITSRTLDIHLNAVFCIRVIKMFNSTPKCTVTSLQSIDSDIFQNLISTVQTVVSRFSQHDCATHEAGYAEQLAGDTTLKTTPFVATLLQSWRFWPVSQRPLPVDTRQIRFASLLDCTRVRAECKDGFQALCKTRYHFEALAKENQTSCSKLPPFQGLNCIAVFQILVFPRNNSTLLVRRRSGIREVLGSNPTVRSILKGVEVNTPLVALTLRCRYIYVRIAQHCVHIDLRATQRITVSISHNALRHENTRKLTASEISQQNVTQLSALHVGATRQVVRQRQSALECTRFEALNTQISCLKAWMRYGRPRHAQQLSHRLYAQSAELASGLAVGIASLRDFRRIPYHFMTR
ncbi:hypothetical protein PR048_029200 [Dryococelus australis]|uniref:Uncharacterized protein n=1 Tax=Dryococelus australis TaxID=614101 RepID=A0ABQ9GCS2_9NEOP|nr:hypothetical protein PR048_029200 [Dryococelus australis]